MPKPSKVPEIYPETLRVMYLSIIIICEPLLINHQILWDHNIFSSPGLQLCLEDFHDCQILSPSCDMTKALNIIGTKLVIFGKILNRGPVYLVLHIGHIKETVGSIEKVSYLGFNVSPSFSLLTSSVAIENVQWLGCILKE